MGSSSNARNADTGAAPSPSGGGRPESALTTKLVKIVGLDPTTASVLQVDQRDIWFVCTTCEPEVIMGTEYPAAMNTSYVLSLLILSVMSNANGSLITT